MADEKAPDTQKVESKDVAKPGDDASAEPKAEVNGTAAEAHKGSEPENNNKPEQPAEKKPTQIPVRQYLEGTVVPLLMQALQKVGKERPEDPITAIIEFLDANNPKKKQRTE